jgi:hypothetical protein
MRVAIPKFFKVSRAYFVVTFVAIWILARLESVIPTQAAPKLPKPNNPPPPPTPKPVPPPLWLSGQLPAAQRGRGAGGYQRGPKKGGRGGQGPPGGHTSNRSAGPPAARGGTGPLGSMVAPPPRK